MPKSVSVCFEWKIEITKTEGFDFHILTVSMLLDEMTIELEHGRIFPLFSNRPKAAE